MEALYPCPVCLGIRMKKKTPEPGKPLVLDVCPICGGVWFDKGEVKELRRVPIHTVKPYIDLSRKLHTMRCHCCYVTMDRNESKCGFCNRKNTIDCPVCDRPMKRTRCRNLILDVCGKCGGVWFDRHELADIWNPAYWYDRRGGHADGNIDNHPAWGLLDGMLYWPDGSGLVSGTGVEGVADVAGHAVAGAGDLISGIPEIAEGAVEGIAEAAMGVVGEAAVEGVAEAAIEGVAEVAVEAVAEAAGSVAEAILEAIVEIIGGALG